MPAELRVTPERDERLLAQAQALAETDAVRLLDLVAAALEATANGAQARIQLELVLVKAAAPEVDPSTAALLARIERLEAGAGRGRPAPRPGAVRAAARDAAERRAGRRARPPPAPAPAPPSPRRLPEPAPAAAGRAGCRAAPTAPSTAGPPELEHRRPPPGRRSSTLVRQDNAMLAALLADARPVALSEQE